MGVFGGIEWAVHETEKKNYKASVAAAADLDRLGYLIQGIKVDGGTLEITCCPPREEKAATRLELKAFHGRGKRNL
jgi:hypothetical protein